MMHTDPRIIQFGTPAICGTLDPRFFESACVEEKPMVNFCYSPMGRDAAETYMPRTTGKMYMLHDDRYLYFGIQVHDETLCSRGREWRMQTVWPWNDDGAEIYLWFSDEDCMAIHNDAHGIRSVVDEHIWGPNHSSACTYHDTPAEDWAASVDPDGQNYNIVIRVALPSYCRSGSPIGTLLEIDDRWAVGSEEVEPMVGALCPSPHDAGAECFRYYLA